ncbi:MAG: hypothetical protein J7502_03570 [Flavisolibacter sp.]|nr:hypothetical protein [Flavisolibacter sp.]
MDKKSKEFVIETSAKALISFIPLIGGAIGSILSDVLAERKEQRMQDFLSQLSKDLEDHKDREMRDGLNRPNQSF